ncbi:MAG: hypothetical protein AB7S26_23990 [Sandaracinaceae bacterium]
MTSGLVLTAIVSLTAGCDPLNLDGDWTWGDEGHARFQIDDGLCPGLGGCDMHVPLAAGSDPRFEIEAPCCPASDLEVTGTGAATVTDSQAGSDNDRLFVDVALGPAGDASLEVTDLADSSRSDHIALDVREPARIECGVVGDQRLYDFADLRVVEETTEAPVFASGATGDVEVACRLFDDGDAALLSAGLIHWTIVEGSEPVTIDPGGFAAQQRATDGARVYVRFSQPGETALLRASAGEDLSWTIMITVE